jgi:hypothetical protein
MDGEVGCLKFWPQLAGLRGCNCPAEETTLYVHTAPATETMKDTEKEKKKKAVFLIKQSRF